MSNDETMRTPSRWPTNSLIKHWADPDDDLRTLARQFLRGEERIAALEAGLRWAIGNDAAWINDSELPDDCRAVICKARDEVYGKSKAEHIGSHFPSNETLRRQIASDPDEDPSVP